MTADSKISCHEAQELLPWLAGGSLDKAVVDRLREHLEDCPECRSSLAQCTELLAASDRHLPAEWIVDLADGRSLEPADAEIARQHLDHCASCRELLAMARRFPEESRRTAGDEPAEQDDRPDVQRAPRSRSRRARRGWLAAAAMLLLSLGWFGTWRQLQETRTSLERPNELAVMSRLVELPPVTLERSEGERRQIKKDAASPYLVLVLISEVEPPSDPVSLLEVQRPDGSALFSIEGPKRDENGLYSVIIPNQGLEPGLYRAELLVNGRATERFEFEIVAD